MTVDPRGRAHPTRTAARSEIDVFDPPFALIRPTRQRLPVVIDSPHSGRQYPEAFLARSRLDPRAIRRSEDGFVDLLFAEAANLGAPLLAAGFPRAYLDVNREPYELDPVMFDTPLPPHVNTSSQRVKGGLGTIARVVADGSEIYTDRLSFAEAEARIERLYRPYHRALGALLAETRAKFGHALLLDCHSMPSVSSAPLDPLSSAPRADIVLGDRFGTACAAEMTEIAEWTLRRQGYLVSRNAPYAGGFITEFFGRPNAGLHALQIEVNRALYMDEETLTLNAGFERLAQDMAALAKALGDIQLNRLAAE